MTTFDIAVAFTLREEGGYVNDPRDPGGETNFGISKRSYPNEDIRYLTRERAIELYRRDFWDALELDSIEPRLAIAIFDTAVNMGTTKAVALAHMAPAWVDYVSLRARDYVTYKQFATYGKTWLIRVYDLYHVCATLKA